MLIAVLSLNMSSDNGLLFYTLAYSVATIVAFLGLYIVGNAKGTTLVSDFRGLGRSQPVLAVAMVVAMLSMAGIPPLAGFMAKYYIFANALKQGYLWLVLFAIVMSLVGVYYYFKVIIAMFFEQDTEGSRFDINPLQTILLVVGCVLLLVLGILPNLVYNLL
ncbi:MAG: hypothetical protein HC817_02025 [Saprospiraceae bacterium]|nr:hypothetical protein [Saprospiraceae bacterium]